MPQEVITALLTLIGTILTGYISYRLGRFQIAQQDKNASTGNGTTREIEFREDLLALIERQEQKIKSQDDKIDKLDSHVEMNKSLVDELKRANLNLAIENQRLKARVLEVETELSKLRKDLL
jgi:septal ring factor EnvC (AmiA/AmiB activator)